MNKQHKIQLTWYPIISMVIFFWAVPSRAITESGHIKGTVFNDQTGEPIPNANVFIKGTLLGAAADKEGHYVIKDIEPGSYHIICSAVGFQRESRLVTIRPAKTSELFFRLQEKAIQMNDFVVTASKYHRAIEEIPVRIDLIKPEDIKSRNAPTLDKALSYVSGVQMAGNNISIRGSSGFSYGLGTRTLVLLDGIPFLSGDEGKVNFEAIPVTEIEQVEVMKGAGSALYGSSAMGGVINIITKDPQPDSSQADFSLYSGFYSNPSYDRWRWSESHRYFRGASLSYNTDFYGISSKLALNYHYNDHFKADADYQNWNLYGKFMFDWPRNYHWRLECGWMNNDFGGFIFWKGLNRALEPGNEPEDSFTRFRQKVFYLQSVMTRMLSSKFYYRLRFNYRRSHSRDIAVARPGYQPAFTGTYRSSRAGTLGHEMQFCYQRNARHNIVFGWDANMHQVNSIHYGNRQLLNGSLYFQYAWQIFANLTAEMGGRWDAEWVEKMANTSKFNPKFGLNYHLSKDTHFRFAAGRGFRTPSIAERFVSTVANQIMVLPNPNLLPEQSASVEIGFLTDIASFSRLDFGYFLTDYWDLIEPQLLSDRIAVRFQNVTRARVQGIELSQNLSLFKKSLQFNCAYTYIRTRDLSEMINGTPNPDYGKELKYRPKHLVYLRTNYNYDKWTAGIDFRYISRIDRTDRLTNIPDVTVRVPAYITDIQVGFDNSNISLMLSANNIFQYYYLIAPGNLGDLRNYTLRFGWYYR